MPLISAAHCEWRIAINVEYKPDDIQRWVDIYHSMRAEAFKSFEKMRTRKFLASIIQFAGIDHTLELRICSKAFLESAEDLVEANIWADSPMSCSDHDMSPTAVHA